MGWYCHPDTLTMASASGRAKEAAGEDGTLAFLRAYHAEYSKEVARNPMTGGVEYLESIEAAILLWEMGDVPDFIECPVPGMGKPSAPKEQPTE